MDNLDKILEGLLFVAGDGIEKGFIMEKLGVTDKQLTKAIDKLKEKYSGDCGINLITYKDKVQMSSNPSYADEISLVLNPIRERNLSKATLETVAIVAYKQPVTRLEIEEIRGVNSDYALQTLMNLKMIEVVGRKDAIGKPLLFGTTEEFLKRFDLQNLSDLPDYEDLIKSIQTLEQENNHLYNEFETPDEEQATESAENSKNEDNKVSISENEHANENNQNEIVKNNQESQLKVEREEKQEDNNEKLEEISIKEQAEKIQVITPLEEPKLVDEEGNSIFNEEFEDELPDFLMGEENLQKIG